MIGFILFMIVVAFLISVFVAISAGNKEECSSSKNNGVVKKERFIDKFNRLYIGQSLYSVQDELGRDCELREERLLRDEKVIKKVYVWRIDKGFAGIGYVRCTFYDNKLNSKEQHNLG